LLFYVLLDAQRRISFSPVPEVDKPLTGSCKFLTPGLPLEALKRYLPFWREQEDGGNESPEKMEKIIIRLILKGLQKDGGFLSEDFEWQDIQESCGGRVLDQSSLENGDFPAEQCPWANEETFGRFGALVEGRQVAEGEYHFLAKKLNLTELELIKLMHRTVLLKRGEWTETLYREGAGWRCRRCGSTYIKEWPSLYGTGATCEDCKSIGTLTSLQVIYRSSSSPTDVKTSTGVGLKSGLEAQGKMEAKTDFAYPEASFVLSFTAAQQEAALKLLSFAAGDSRKEILVWAACGAGKTEICFPLLQHYLEEGKNILFAAPRRDVVHDVQPRLQKNFPAYRVRLLSGAVPPDWEKSQLTVATTHQVLRFWRAFDLIIFDEMDAYPYHGSQVLAYGLRQALKEDGRLVYLTATPAAEILPQVNSGQISLIRLPARHHGYPLPVPEVLKLKLPAGDKLAACQILKDKSLAVLKALIGELAAKDPLLVFLPTISLVKEWTKVLQAVFPDKSVAGSWSTDRERKNKVSALLKGQISIFVSTSILERGITVSGLQVMVLYAQHELYDVRTLVQMAGRTGRTAQCPSGRAVFVAPRETKAMAGARDWIKEQNTLARKGGFLHA
jgi:competence protein ComFA